MNQSEEDILNKLIVLFVFDKMGIALDEKTIINICYTQNSWMMPLYCMDAMQKIGRASCRERV